MPVFIYNILLALYAVVIHPVSWFNPKAKKWIEGRKNWRTRLRNTHQTHLRNTSPPRPNGLAGRASESPSRHFGRPGEVLWIHAASLGEFEQGRPIIEHFRKNYPAYKIVLTFYSPSGYEIRKDYDQADIVCYLPMDGSKNARDFIDIIKPTLVIFIKYEFWYHYLNELRKQNIPTVIISTTFRESQPFFQWYGGFFRKMLSSFTLLFVQDEISKRLLAGIGIKDNVLIAGDTRYDRVFEIAAQAKTFPAIEKFKAHNDLVIAGSTWPDDEKMLKDSLNTIPAGWKLVIAPHEIDKDHLSQVKSLFGNDMVLYSELTDGNGDPEKKVLVIDNIGMLSSLYRYGKIACIGGGFSKGGIHNALEPAVFGSPVLFGPVYEKFAEARALVAAGFAFPVSSSIACDEVLASLINDPVYLTGLNAGIHQFMQQNKGSTLKIIKTLEAQKLL